MLPARYQLISPATHPNYPDMVDSLAEACWPEFMLQDPVADEYWGELFEHFSEYQFGLLDSETGFVPVMANSIPLRWDSDLADLPDKGWDWAFEQAVRDHRAGLEPNLQCALQIAIHPDYRNQGLSAYMVRAMREIGRRKGFAHLIAPVRPSLKNIYPLTPMENYITWTTPESLPFDPWLRVHVRVGGRILKPCLCAMTIRGSVADWEEWTGMKFPESGTYIVPGALHPVEFDLEANEGLYIEANVWTVHSNPT
jgi:GNAT superfamily N-acetyltransferase